MTYWIRKVLVYEATLANELGYETVEGRLKACRALISIAGERLDDGSPDVYLSAYFLDDVGPHKPRVDTSRLPTSVHGQVFLPVPLFDAWLDLLRNEAPIWIYLNDNPAFVGGSGIGTREEPPGEGLWDRDR